MRRIVVITVMVLALVVSAFAGEYKVLDSRPDGKARIYIDSKSKYADTAVILLPGGKGAGAITKLPDGTFKFSDNYIVKEHKKFVDAGMIAVIMDTPTDAETGLPDAYRKSDEQVKDMLAIFDAVKVKRIFIVSFSRAGLSLTSLCSKISDKRLRGAVIVSTIQCKDYCCENDLSKITIPMLFVQHKEDGCNLNSWDGAMEIYKEINKKNKNLQFITITEGKSPEGADPCQTKSIHGFYGFEDGVTKQIINWITTR